MWKLHFFENFITLLVAILLKENVTMAQAQMTSNFATKVPELTDYRSTSGALIEYKARAVTQCADECSNTLECRSFFFNKQSRFCQLQEEMFDSYDPATHTDFSGTKYYKMKIVRTNSMCPLALPDSTYYKVLLSDNTIFTYRIVWDWVDAVMAKAACEADDARLVQVLTLAKMQMLVNIFTTCPGYVGGSRFWIDGSNVNAANFSDITQWTTSTGEPLPTTNQFWFENNPDLPEIYHCVALWKSYDYRWINPPCSYDKDMSYICEK